MTGKGVTFSDDDTVIPDILPTSKRTSVAPPSNHLDRFLQEQILDTPTTTPSCSASLESSPVKTGGGSVADRQDSPISPLSDISMSEFASEFTQPSMPGPKSGGPRGASPMKGAKKKTKKASSKQKDGPQIPVEKTLTSERPRRVRNRPERMTNPTSAQEVNDAIGNDTDG